MKPISVFFNLCLCIALLLGSSQLRASTENKPFAEKRIVLQISDPNPFKQTLVLNVANNLVKHYGPDKVDVEIVAFGPGLRLLMDGNSNETRISGLSKNGIRFSACQNTLNAMKKQLGHTPKLVSQATPVSAGVVRILDLTTEGYSLVKP